MSRLRPLSTWCAAALLAACATPAPQPAPSWDVVIRGGTIYDGSGGAPLCRRRRDRGRPYRLRRAAVARSGRARDRRARPRRRARLHQHAELVDRIADRGPPRPERDPPGRHPRGDGRGLVDGPAQRRDEAARNLAPGRHPLSDRMDQPRRISRVSRAARHLAQHRQLRRRDDRPHPRARRGRRRSRRPSSWRGCARWSARR